MAKVQKRIMIELTKEEKKFLDSLLSSLYDIADDNNTIAGIFSDIYNSFYPLGDEGCSKWTGSCADIIIKN